MRSWSLAAPVRTPSPASRLPQGRVPGPSSVFLQAAKSPDKPGFFCTAVLLRRGVQRFRGRDRYGFYAVDIFLDLIQQRTRLGWRLWLRLLGILHRSVHLCAVLAQDRFIAAYAGFEVARQAGELIIGVEYQADTLLLAFTATGLQAIQVIPAIGVECVGQQRVAHDKPYLLAGHSRAQLVYHVLRDDIALLDVDFVNPGE